MSATTSMIDPNDSAVQDSAELSEELRAAAYREEKGEMTDEEILQHHMTKGGVISNYKTSAVIADELDREGLRRAIKAAVLEYSAKQKIANESKEKAEREVSKKRSLISHIEELRAQIDVLGSHVENRPRVRNLKKELASIEVSLGEQEQLAEREIQLMNQACKEADYAEMALDRFGDTQGMLEKMLEEEKFKDTVVSKYRVKTEKNAALRFENARRSKEQDIKMQQATQDELVKAQIQATKREHKRALTRRRDFTQHRDSALGNVMAIQSAAHEKRVNAVLGLKKSTDNVFAELRGNVAQAKQLEAERKAREKEEFDSLLAEGKNPYEVFRRRKQQLKLRADRARLINRQKQSEIDVAEKMINEEKHFVKKDKIERKKKQFAQVYRDSLGRHVTEQRTRDYMLDITKEHKDFVDPTGRMFRIEGSHHTALKDRSFGLGTMASRRPDIVAKEAARPAMKGVVPSERHSYVVGAAAMGVTSGAGTGGSRMSNDVSKTDKLTDELLGVAEIPGERLGINQDNMDSKTYTSGPPAKSHAKKESGGSLDTGAAGVASLPDDPAADAAAKKGPLGTRELSKLEKRYMAEALERQRTNIVQKQVVWGKEFKGQAFISSPDKIIFKDFEVGKKMKRRFTLTNTSFSFNHFKVLSLPDEIMDFFTITFKKPGRMSAGMTCSILIEFDPKLNVDINSALPLLAQTGPFSIPLICTTKKIVPSVSTDLLSMGTVILGDAISGKVRIKNDGALPTRYRIELAKDTQADGLETVPVAAVRDDFEFDAETDELINQDTPPGKEKPDVLTFVSEGDVAPYTTVDVEFTFRPRQPGKLGRSLEFHFEGSDVVSKLEIEATAKRVPIYVEQRMIDLRCCVVDKLYRAAVLVRNRGSVALKMQTNIPDELTPEELGFSPPMCFVQGRDGASGEPGSFTVQMKFRPTPDTLAACSTYVDPDGEGDNTIIIVPLHITVPGQTLKVLFRFRAKLTSSDVIFDPPSIDFGPCFTDRAVSFPLKITNTSALPQRFGFVKLPREVSVPFQDGFGTLLPFETIERDIVFSPTGATVHNFALTFSTYLNRTFKIQCHGRGVKPPLSFSHTLLKLACTPKEERVEESIFVKNTTRHSQTFEFGAPALELSGLQISPTCAVLAPGHSTRVEIVFTPGKVDFVKLNKGIFGDSNKQEENEEKSEMKEETEGGVDVNEVETQETEVAANVNIPVINFEMPPPQEATFDRSNPADGSSEPEAQSSHAQWKISCFVKETHQRQIPRSPRSARAASMQQPTLCLEIHTTTLAKRKLIAEVPQETQSSFEKSLPLRLDFGQMAVGQEEIAPIRITNTHDAAVMLSVLQGPNVQGPFSFVNALRPLAPAGRKAHGYTNEDHKTDSLDGRLENIIGEDLEKDNMLVYVRFKPEDQLIFCERVTFQTSAGTASVTLAGQGVSPILELLPSDGNIDMGQVLAGDSSTKSFTLRNASVFPVRYEIIPNGKMPENYNSLASFLCTPEEATISPGDTQEVIVRSQPDHSLPYPHKCELTVRVPTTNESKALSYGIHLQARTWARQLYVRPQNPSDEPPIGSKDLIVDPFAVPVELCVPPMSNDSGAAGITKEPEQAPRRVIRLEFPKSELSEEGSTADAGNRSTEKFLLVGACNINEEGRTGAGGSFTFRPLDSSSESAKYFSVTPATGSAKPGEDVEVTCKFSPPDEPGDDEENKVCVVVGQWVEMTFECVLKGGYVPPGAPDEEIVHVLLRGFVVS